ncbi:hypothetical protein LTR62_006874 [Meristemomyces frigidus]|uniref:Chromatin modification-related protein EAF7 n=1 Tax=Meristemomyces frigidus TaxID=1508187 RepID=A0AAN7TBD7_9PEZI|nr:hypothetical protein LTR62_006874 [Meristemomyces frigidus]
MPPRKRARLSQATSPEHAIKSPTPVAEAEESGDGEKQMLEDAWTDEEEIGLLKGLMTWKPTGIHKHFRLIALHNFLLDNNYIHPLASHTKPAGIWRKLQTLYDLDALDEREDARQLSDLSQEAADEDGDEDDVYSEAENKIHRQDFILPSDGDDFAGLMWRQRLLGEGEAERQESPAELPELNFAVEPPIRFTPSFSVEPSRESATPVRVGKQKAGRGRPRGSAATAVTASGTRRSARQADSVAEEEEAEVEEGEGDDDQDESEDEEQSERSTPARSTRTAARGRGRPAGRARGRGRGRGK